VYRRGEHTEERQAANEDKKQVANGHGEELAVDWARKQAEGFALERQGLAFSC
jgi:hypothetical protein